MAIGYHIHRAMIVPPNSKNFTITSFINEDCTNKVSRIWHMSQCFPIDTSYNSYLSFYSSFLKMVFMCLETFFIHMLLVSRIKLCFVTLLDASICGNIHRKIYFMFFSEALVTIYLCSYDQWLKYFIITYFFNVILWCECRQSELYSITELLFSAT